LPPGCPGCATSLRRRKLGDARTIRSLRQLHIRTDREL
jgi:hypothetical protein